MNRRLDRAIGLVAGYGLDQIFADPRRFHPVAGFGWTATRLERLTYANSRTAGVLHAVALIGGAATVGILTRPRSRPATIAATAVAAWAVLGGHSLRRAGTRMADLLEREDITGARELLPTLCGRDAQLLDGAGLTRAALESVAENTSDAAVAPLFWGAIAGVPGLLGYRAINTLDAMIGYRNARYLRFGWAAARIDDAANLLPARLTGLLTVAVGANPTGAWQAWRHDAKSHPSPNAGIAEAAMAGALSVRLGGRTTYRHGTEDRPHLGTGAAPGIADLRRAVHTSAQIEAAAVVTSAVVAVAVSKSLRR